MLATFFLCCAMLSATATDNQQPQGTPPPVRLLLFAQTTPRSITISSSSPVTVTTAIDPPQKTERKRLPRTEIRAERDGRMLRVGTTNAASVVITGERIILQSEGRKRVVAGIVTITQQGKQLRVVATIAQQQYLSTALASESASGEPFQYLIALSVLQRNYLQTHRNRHQPDADLCDNTHCQRADNTSPSKTVQRAVAAAAKIQLTDTTTDGTAYPCYYSANCGGSTLTPKQVWGSSEAGYSAVACDFCRQGKWNRWQRATAATPQVEQLVRQAPPAPFLSDDFKIAMGRMVGFNVVLSNTVENIERREGKFWFSGRGFGHRVGLCCAGGMTLAKRGRAAAEILRTYFPDASVGVAEVK